MTETTQEFKPKGSTTIIKAVYRPEGRTMDVWFLAGFPYRYFDVPAARFAEWQDNYSAGQYHAREIAKKFPYVKLQCSSCGSGIDPSVQEFWTVTMNGRMVVFHLKCGGGK